MKNKKIKTKIKKDLKIFYEDFRKSEERESG